MGPTVGGGRLLRWKGLRSVLRPENACLELRWIATECIASCSTDLTSKIPALVEIVLQIGLEACVWVGGDASCELSGRCIETPRGLVLFDKVRDDGLAIGVRKGIAAVEGARCGRWKVCSF